MIIPLVYTLLVFFSLWGIGVLIIRHIPGQYESILEKYLFSIGIGYALLTNILFLLGLISLVNQYSILFIFIISLIISSIALRNEQPLSTININSLKNIKTSTIAIIAILSVLTVMNLIGALAPPSLADSLRHHLAAPEYYGKVGGFPFVPIHPWSFPGLMHILFTKVLILSDAISCQLIIFIFNILTALSVYGITRKYFGSISGLLAMLIYYSLPLTTELSTGAMTEHAANFLSLMSVWAILNGFENKTHYKPSWLVLSGLLGGCAGATKLWALLGGPATFIIIIYICFKNSVKSKECITLLVAYSAVYGIILAPWLIRNFVASGNPLWPIGFHFFDTQYYSEISVLKYSNWVRGPETSFLNYFLTPWHLTNNISQYSAGAGAISHYLINPVFLAFIPSIFIFWKKNNNHQKQLFSAIGIFSIGVYTIWFLGGYTQPRYIQLIYPCLSIITASCVVNILELENGFIKYISRIFIGVSLLAMITVSLVINIKYIPVFFGAESEYKYLNNMVSHYSSIDWMNKNLPDDSKILYVGYSAWFYLDREYMPMANRYIDYYNIESSSELKEILDKYKITHVYIEGDPDDIGPKLQEIGSGDIMIKDLKLNSIEDCEYWLNMDSDSLPFNIITYHHLRPFILLSGMELTNNLELIKIIKSKVVLSRIRGVFKDVEDAVYILK